MENRKSYILKITDNNTGQVFICNRNDEAFGTIYKDRYIKWFGFDSYDLMHVDNENSLVQILETIDVSNYRRGDQKYLNGWCNKKFINDDQTWNNIAIDLLYKLDFEIYNLNSKWAFTKEIGEIPTAIDNTWDFVNLPHCWNAIDGQDGGNDYFRGSCVYVKTLTKADVPQGEKVYLERP